MATGGRKTVMVLGPTGAGKSRVANFLLPIEDGNNRFEELAPNQERRVYGFQHHTGMEEDVIEVPGFPRQHSERIDWDDVVKAFDHAGRAHLFLLVLDSTKPKENKAFIERFLEYHGEIAALFSVVVFTHNDSPFRKTRSTRKIMFHNRFLNGVLGCGFPYLILEDGDEEQRKQVRDLVTENTDTDGYDMHRFFEAQFHYIEEWVTQKVKEGKFGQRDITDANMVQLGVPDVLIRKVLIRYDPLWLEQLCNTLNHIHVD